VGVALCLAVWADLQAPATDLHPYASIDMAAGTTIDDSTVVWREVAAGALEPVDLPAVAARPVHAGDPVVVGDVSRTGVRVPAGWWRVELEVPPGSAAGDRVGVVVVEADGGATELLEGMVAGAPVADGFGGTAAVCAFPEDVAVRVTVALAEGRLATVTSNG
jgi:hypothetical protein